MQESSDRCGTTRLGEMGVQGRDDEAFCSTRAAFGLATAGAAGVRDEGDAVAFVCLGIASNPVVYFGVVR